MPSYKQLPSQKKNTVKQPIAPAWYLVPENWISVGTPVVIVVVVMLIAFGAIKLYTGSIAEKSSTLVSAPGIDAAGLEAVVQKYPKSDAAAVARVKLGKLALDQSRWDDAIAWYAPVAEKSSAPALLRVTALQNQALAYLKKNDAAKASGLLEQARRDAGNEDADYSDLLSAHVYDVSGQKDKAAALYKSLAEGAKDPNIKNEAQERLKWIDLNS